MSDVEPTDGKPKSKKTFVDWDVVADDIRAGVLSDRQIGAKHGRSHGAIHQYAKKHGIERDLSLRIKQTTKTKLSRKLSSETIQTTGHFTEEQTIEIAATAAATVVIAQQGRIGRHLSVSKALLDELEAQTINRELYERLGEMMKSPDENGDRLNDLYRKVISTSSRIDSHKKAVDTEKTLIALERQVFNLDDKASGLDNVAEAIRAAFDE